MTRFRRARLLLASLLLCTYPLAPTPAQEPASKPLAKSQLHGSEPNEKSTEGPQLPFQIQLLETKVRFEANGDSRKEIHTIVSIINILGAQQFARLAFDYNRKFQQVEIPLVRVSHANGGTSELLPSAVTDTPHPATAPFPAYQDVRVKSFRILGLHEGDTIEYRVVITTSNAPFAPDFCLQHTFDDSGQVLLERYELDLPNSRNLEPRINSKTPPASKESAGAGENAFTIYKWNRKFRNAGEVAHAEDAAPDSLARSDVTVSTFTWETLSSRLAELLLPGSQTPQLPMKELERRPEVAQAVREKATELTHGLDTDEQRMKAIYHFVSTQINTVDLPLGATGFQARPAEDVLASGYAIGEDKYVLLAAMATATNLRADAVLTGFCDRQAPATPAAFQHLVVLGSTKDGQHWLDPAIEVAPFGVISPSAAKCAFLLRREFSLPKMAGQEWIATPTIAPFAAFQRVTVDATISETGQLSARVKYVVRGQNELLLRVAFHQAPEEKWKDVATLLSISDGFRGQVTNATASDPLQTDGPFTVEYDLTQLKFVDWSKKPLRIPALLPQIGLPDPPRPEQGNETPQIELGTPLDVQTVMTLKLPEGTTVQTPAGTTVTRDYAAYASKYSTAGNTVVASRSINFLKRGIPGDRAFDYNAFLRSVQNDQFQRFVLVPAETRK